MTTIKLGDEVAYQQPTAAEHGLTFTIIDIDTANDWCMLRANVAMNIKPTYTANLSDLKKCNILT